MADRPGNEIPKDYRAIADELVRRQGWRYATGKGHPILYPADKTQRPIPVPTTPSRHPRALANWTAQIRRAGGIWPPAKEG